MINFTPLFKKVSSVAVIGPLSLLLGLVSLQKIAQAQMSITPQVVELNAKRGQAQGSILLVNGASSPLDTKSYIQPFTYDQEDGFQELKDSPQDLTPYIQLYPVNVTLTALEQRRFRFVVKLPPNLPDGEYRAMIFTDLNLSELPKDQPVSGKDQIIMTTKPRIGVAVYVRKGNINPEISVENVNWDGNKSQAKILVKNSGKASSVLTGEWTLKQDNKIINEGQIQPTTVIAENARSVNVSMTSRDSTIMQKLAPGRYQLEGNIFSRNQKFPYQTSFEVTASK